MDKNQNSDAHLACAQKLNELQGLLQNGIVVTNSVAVQKSVQKKDSSECKTWWTSWCKAPDGQKFLALFDGRGKVKLIPEADKGKYIIKTVK